MQVRLCDTHEKEAVATGHAGDDIHHPADTTLETPLV